MGDTNAWDDENFIDSEKKEKTIAEDRNNLIVKIIDDDSDQITVNLGISDEEGQRLEKHIFLLLREHPNLSTVLHEISKECKHANQLAFACFALGRVTSNKSRRRDDDEGTTIGRIGIVMGKDGKIEHIDGASDSNDLPDFIKDILTEIMKRKKKGDNN